LLQASHSSKHKLTPHNQFRSKVECRAIQSCPPEVQSFAATIEVESRLHGHSLKPKAARVHRIRAHATPALYNYGRGGTPHV
jgi:hypothetical protein